MFVYRSNDTPRLQSDGYPRLRRGTDRERRPGVPVDRQDPHPPRFQRGQAGRLHQPQQPGNLHTSTHKHKHAHILDRNYLACGSNTYKRKKWN